MAHQDEEELGLLAAARDMTSAPLPEPAAEAFLAAWPLPRVFDALTAASSSPSSLIDDVAAALSRAFKTRAGARALPEAETYARAALSAAPSPALRRLGAEQLGRLLALQQQDDDNGASASSIAAELAAALSDPDSGVAAEAGAALRAHAASSPRAFGGLVDPLTEAGAALRALAEGGDAVARMRALSLLAGAAAAAAATRASSGGGAGAAAAPASSSCCDLTAALEESGLVRALMRELEDPSRDPLSALSSLAVAQQMLEEAGAARGEGASSAARALAAALLPRLSEVLRFPGAGGGGRPCCDPTVASGALPIAARLAAAALQEEADERAAADMANLMRAAEEGGPGGAGGGAANGAGRHASSSSSPAADLARPLLRALPSLLADDDRDLAHAALDAAGQLFEAAAAADFAAREAAAAEAAGATTTTPTPSALHAVCELALSRAGAGGAPHVRVAALHALASLAGCERAGQRRERSAALLSPAAEGALRRAVYAASAPRSPSDAVAALTRQPIDEVSSAAYRLAAALLLRGWFAGDAAAAAALAPAEQPSSASSDEPPPPPALLEVLLPPLPGEQAGAGRPSVPAPRSTAEAQWRRSCANAVSATVAAAAEVVGVVEGGGNGHEGDDDDDDDDEDARHPDSDLADLRHNRAALLSAGLAERAARAAGGSAGAGGAGGAAAAAVAAAAHQFQVATVV
jgi:hypothetical protein